MERQYSGLNASLELWRARLKFLLFTDFLLELGQVVSLSVPQLSFCKMAIILSYLTGMM